jgi:putative two-component system response regulator
MMRNSVLFVDDEQPVRSAMERVFLERDDIRCLFADSAASALELLESEQVQVVVSDYLMPGMRGTEFLSRVKMLYPQTVRIMMTAHADLNIAIEAINRSEAFRFLTKPWDNQELIETVDEALMRFRLVQSLSSNDDSLYLSLAQTVELKDPYTKGHCDRVAKYALRLAEMAGFSGDILRDIRYGSWLHDCGKIGVPEAVLNSASFLSEDEMELVRKHPLWGAEVARQARMSETVVNIILHHHERFDGSGYPAGLKGEKIPVEARIVAIADVFDALYTDRPYRKAYSRETAIDIMKEMTANFFDPRLMDLFLSISNEQ